MNRIDFMTELASLLQDISAEERREAMKYYNNYLDDAGIENEEEAIKELGSPSKVAAEVKAGLGAEDRTAGEFRETGYTDTRFEDREMPGRCEAKKQSSGQRQEKGNADNCQNQYGGGGNGQYRQEQYRQEPPRTSTGVKVLLVLAVLFIGLPIILPVAISVFCIAVVLALLAVFFFLGLVAAGAALAFTGITLCIAGVPILIPAMATGLVLIGTGLLLLTAGAIWTVAAVRVCIIVLPGLFRGCVELIRRPFYKRRKVA